MPPSQGKVGVALGTHTAASGTLTVNQSDNADGVVVANAVTIVQTQAPSTAPSMVDNSDGAFSESGSGWEGYSDSSSVDGGFRYCAAHGREHGAMDLRSREPRHGIPGLRHLGCGRKPARTHAPYTVSDGGTTLATVDMNQQFAPSDATIGGQGWESLWNVQPALPARPSPRRRGEHVGRRAQRQCRWHRGR